MDAVYIVFMVLVCFFCVFCMGIALMDMVGEAMNRKKRRQLEAETLTQAIVDSTKQPAPEKEPAPVVEEPAPVVEEVVEPVAEETAEPEATEEVLTAAEAPVAEEAAPVEEVAVAEEAPAAEEEAVEEAPAEETPAEEEDGAVSFRLNAANQETLDEKYLALSKEEKGYYDAILFHAVGKEGSRRFRTARHEEIKIGRTRLVRMSIKRGVVTCEFTLYNTDFKNYIDENKLSVKHASTVLKITSQAAVQAAMDSIDLAVQSAEREKEYKKQLARENRKQARLAKAAEENGEAAEATEAPENAE